MESLLLRLRQTRWANLCVVNVRFLIGFAFVPSALKKVLDQPFTDPANSGRFHDFLHAFHATGWFYQFVGIMQLVTALLLFTQRFATAGALIALPILTAITAFCWSTRVIPTATVATLMLVGTLALVIWDLPKWRGIFAPDHDRSQDRLARITAPIDVRLWQACGLAILALYLGLCLAHGGVYRPRGMDLGDPAFYVLPAIMLLPVVTLVIERTRRQRYPGTR